MLKANLWSVLLFQLILELSDCVETCYIAQVESVILCLFQQSGIYPLGCVNVIQCSFFGYLKCRAVFISKA